MKKNLLPFKFASIAATLVLLTGSAVAWNVSASQSEAHAKVEASAEAVTLVKSYPKANSTVEAYDKINQITLTFNQPVEIDRAVAGDVKIETKYLTLFQTPISNANAFYVNPDNNTQVILKLENYLGKYPDDECYRDWYFRLPAGAIKAADSDMSNEDIEFSFQIGNHFQCNVSIKSGETVEESQLTDITLSYPTAKFVTREDWGIVADADMQLIEHDPATSSSNVVGHYAYKCVDASGDNPSFVELTLKETVEFKGAPVTYEVSIPLNSFFLYASKADMEDCMINQSGAVDITDLTVALPAPPAPSLGEILSLSAPAAMEANPKNAPNGLGVVKYTLKDSKVSKADEALELKATLSFEGTEIATCSLEEANFVPAVGNNDDTEDSFLVGAGSFDLYFSELPVGDEFKKNGEYTVLIPEGFLLYDDVPMGAFEFKYNYTAEVEDDFTYVLTPSGESAVSSLTEIVLAFPNATQLDYSDNVATLVSEDGSVNLSCSTPRIDWANNAFVFSFGWNNTQWVSGKYTFTVNPGRIAVDDPEWDEWCGRDANFPGLTMVYELQVKEPENFADYYSLLFPSTTEVTPDNCQWPGTNDEMMTVGLGIVQLGLNTDLISVAANGDWLMMSYSAAEEDVPNVIGVINPLDDKTCQLTGIQPHDVNVVAEGDEELPTVDPVYQLTLLFANNGSGAYSEEEGEAYHNKGYYTLDIPDGTFLYDGEPMKGVSIVYSYSGDATEVVTVNEYTKNVYDVYSLDGTVVLQKASSLKGLTPGLYVINGNKVLVK